MTLMTIVAADATRKPAQGRSSNALPPRRPMKNAYRAQMMAAAAVPVTNRRRG